MDQYFQLRDDVGITGDGNLEPLDNIGIVVAVPIMRGGEVVEDPHRYHVVQAESLSKDVLARVIPGSRTIHVNDPTVAEGIWQTGLFVQIDKPTKKQLADQVREAKAAEEEAGTHNGDPDPTNPDNPVNDDGTPVHPVIPAPEV